LADFRIVVHIDPNPARRGSRQVKGELDGISRSVQRLQGLLVRAFAFAGIGVGIAGLIRLNDTFVEVANRAKVADINLNGMGAQLDDLFSIAQRTRGPVDALTSVYQRASLAANELGASQDDLLRFVEAVGQGLAVQGGAANTARGSLLQLSQALGTGIVRAEEFNSILEGAFPIALAAANGLDRAGGSVARLRTLIINGQVTSEEFFNAILAQTDDLARLFAATTPTLGQAFSVINNGLVRAAANIQNFTGPLAQFLVDVGRAISAMAGLDISFLEDDDLRRVNALRGGIEILGRSFLALTQIIVVQFVGRGIAAAIAGIRALGVAVLKNPLGALATALLVTTAFFVSFSDKVALTAGSSATAFDFMRIAGERLWNSIKGGIDLALGFMTNFQQSVDNFDFLQFVRTMAIGIDGIVGFLRGLAAAAIATFKNIPDIIGSSLFGAINIIIGGIETLINGIVTAMNTIPGVAIDAVDIPRLETQFGEIGTDIGTAFTDAFEDQLRNGLTIGVVDDIAREAEMRARQNFTANLMFGNGGSDTDGAGAPPPRPPGPDENYLSQIRALEQSYELLQLDNREREIRQGLLNIENKLNRELTESERERVQGLLESIQAQNDANTINQTLDNLRDEAQLLQMATREREIYSEVLSLETQLNRELTASERENLEVLLRGNQARREELDILEGVLGPQQDYERNLAAINRLWEKGELNLQQYNQALRDNRLEFLQSQTDVASGVERGLLRMAEDMNDFASSAEEVVVNAFQGMEDALVEFVTTGKLNFSDLVNSILADITRLAIQQSITGPLSNFLSSGFSSSGGGGGGDIFSAIGSIVGSFFGGPGAATGGSMLIGGNAGTDNNQLSLNGRPIGRVSRGEELEIHPKNGGGRGGTTVVNMTVYAEDANSFKRSQNQIAGKLATQIDRARQRSV